MVIYFLRHASAGQHLINPAKDDKRPLDSEGIRQCGYIGRACSAMDLQIDLVISSPLKRALQTATLVATEMGYDSKISVDRALLPNADYNSFRELIARHARTDSIMVVGHNPSLSDFLSRTVSARAGKAEIDLKKGAVARVEVEGKQATLQWLVTPKMVKTIYESSTPKLRPKTSRK
jgi:phosphohistidine phosphatase